MKKTDSDSERRIAYAEALEHTVYQLHEQFWYDLDEQGVLRPVAAVGDERRLLELIHRGLKTVSQGTGRQLDFKVKRRLDRRLILGLSFVVSFLFLLDVIWNDILGPYQQIILSWFDL